MGTYRAYQWLERMLDYILETLSQEFSFQYKIAFSWNPTREMSRFITRS
jgi:hypothetical protein